MQFDPKKYIYPPRPILCQIDWEMVQEINDSPEWVAELKLNGDRCMIFVYDGIFEFWSRHGHTLKRYSPSEQLLDALQHCGIPDGSIIDGELIHMRHHSIKHTLLFYDVLAWNGEYTNRLDLEQRVAFLDRLNFGRDLWRSLQYSFNIYPLFDAIMHGREHPHLTHATTTYGQDITPLIEGLVLKKRIQSRFTLERRSAKEVGWMFKVRVPHKNYLF